MKERPIIFSAIMVRAILDGSKSQTRRIIKAPEIIASKEGSIPIRCPHGIPGDHLYVREQWQAWTEFDNDAPYQLPPGSNINYPANGNLWDSRRRPSIHMPRWASRITLEITGVRVERLQQINEADAKAEGVRCGINEFNHQTAFGHLWESIHGFGSWLENPHVFVIEFRRLP